MKYYSFLIGGVISPRSNWLLDDVKMPAMSVKEAVFLYYVSKDYRYRTKDIFWSPDKSKYIAPGYGYIEQNVHRVIEYERKYTPRYGYTQHSYRKIRYYSKHSLLLLYKSTK